MRGNIPERAAENILRMAQDRRISRSALAAATGIPASSLYRKLGDRADSLTLKDLGDIAEALETEATELLRDPS